MLYSKPPSYDDYVASIPADNRPELEKKVDYQHNGVDKDLSDIAAVLLNWEGIVPHLNLTEIDVEDVSHYKPEQQRYASINREANQCLHNIRFQILRGWKAKFGFNATYGVLLKACSDGQCASAAEKIVTLLGGTVTQGKFFCR